ncbi:MAG TPA: helix-turn-helix transcriptional regulator [Chitinophagales bacterium]|nr:helix-turn-helix transcriptional regulator [Chitinophagales bacterium]
MNKKQNKATPVHRFYNAGQVHFKFVTITEASFEVPDVEHRHGYWTVFVFLEGKGRHVIDFKEVPIKPGSIHMVLPGQIHALHGGKNFLAYALMFTEEFFLMRDETIKLLMRLFGFMDAGEAAAFTITKEEKDFFTSLLTLIKQEYNSQNANKGAVLLDLLSVFITKCISALQLPQLNHQADNSLDYIRLRNEVEHNFHTIHTVAGYAQRLGLSAKQLNEICRQHTGNTALDFIHARIVIEAKRLLKYSDKPIKQIAYELNFTDAAHFTNFFRQRTGITPAGFKIS